MEAGLTRERLEEMLSGVGHEDSYEILSELAKYCRGDPKVVARLAGQLSEALSDPAVAYLARRYGASLSVRDNGYWTLAVPAPLQVEIFYNGHFGAAALDSRGHAVALAEDSSCDCASLLGELGNLLMAKVEAVRREEELRRWLASAWPGVELEPDPSVSDEERARLGDVEETARALAEAAARARAARGRRQPEQQQQPRGGNKGGLSSTGA